MHPTKVFKDNRSYQQDIMLIRVYHSTSLTRIWFGSCWCPCLSWRPSTSKFSIFVTNDYERQNLVIIWELSRGRALRKTEVVPQLRRGGTSWSTSWSSPWSCSRWSLWLKKWRSFYNTNSKEYVYDERRRTWRRRCMQCMQYVMELAKRLLDLHICYFLPDHSNNLANQFRWLCFGKYMINYYSF